jgi:hypothetical protein
MEVFMKMNVEVFNEKIMKNVVLGSLVFPTFWHEIPQLSATVKSVSSQEDVH